MAGPYFPSEIVDQITKGIQRTPGNILGSAVDASNLILGLATGQGLKGFTPEPMGGSEFINKGFGLGKNEKEQGIYQDTTEFLTGIVNPASAIKGAMIVGLPIALRGDPNMISRMEQAGKSTNEILTRTGVFRGSEDKKLRTFISDKDAKIIPGKFQEHEGHFYPLMNTKVGDYLDHPELFKQYPQLKNLKIDVMRGKPGEAAFNPALDTIFVAGVKNIDELKTVLLHELQHGVQDMEGFSRGSSISKELGPQGEDLLKNLKSLKDKTLNPADTTDIQSRINQILDQAIKRYSNNPGEQEAKFTENFSTTDFTGLKEVINNILKRGQTTQDWNIIK